MSTTLTSDPPPADKTDAVRTHRQAGSAWPAGVACAGFFVATLVLFRAHGLLHWQIIRDHRAQFEGQLKEDLFRLLSHLEIYHLTALFTVIFAVWSFQGQPRWIRWVCVPMLVTSGLLCLVIM